MAGLPPTITDTSVTLTWGPIHQYYGYCTIADVQFEFPNLASFTQLTSSNIAQCISYAANELQRMIGLVYQMPYTGTDGGIQLQLRNMNAKLATAEIIDRNFQGNEPDLSPAAAERRQYVELLVADLISGTDQWAPPFGDAIPLADKPQYPQAAGATISPSPNDLDPNVANPVFRMSGQTPYRTPQF